MLLFSRNNSLQDNLNLSVEHSTVIADIIREKEEQQYTSKQRERENVGGAVSQFVSLARFLFIVFTKLNA